LIEAYTAHLHRLEKSYHVCEAVAMKHDSTGRSNCKFCWPPWWGSSIHDFD